MPIVIIMIRAKFFKLLIANLARVLPICSISRYRNHCTAQLVAHPMTSSPPLSQTQPRHLLSTYFFPKAFARPSLASSLSSLV